MYSTCTCMIHKHTCTCIIVFMPYPIIAAMYNYVHVHALCVVMDTGLDVSTGNVTRRIEIDLDEFTLNKFKSITRQQ